MPTSTNIELGRKLLKSRRSACSIPLVRIKNEKMEQDSYTPQKGRKDLKSKEELSDKEYIENRVVYKIDLYFERAKSWKKWYQIILFFTIVFGALVPILMNWELLDGWLINGDDLATIFSILVVVLVALETVFQFRERYKNAKRTEDQMTTELFLFQTKSEPYNAKEKVENFKLFVYKIESIIAKERKDTVERVTAKKVEDQQNNTK